jgi:hypothetical protein
MSWFATWAVRGKRKPVDGDHVATNTGWKEFGDWAERLRATHFKLWHLAVHGVCFTADGETEDALAGLEADLGRALADRPGNPRPNVLSVAKRLLDEVRHRPEGAVALAITDGTGG